MHIRPLTAVDREAIGDLARNAADNATPLYAANVFPQGSERSAWFTQAYLDRRRELAAAEA